LHVYCAQHVSFNASWLLVEEKSVIARNLRLVSASSMQHVAELERHEYIFG